MEYPYNSSTMKVNVRGQNVKTIRVLGGVLVDRVCGLVDDRTRISVQEKDLWIRD